MISKFRFNFTNFDVIICLFFCFSFTKILILGILFSAVVNVVFVAKPLILVISFFISLVLALQSVFVTSPLVSGILFSSSDLSVLYLVFKTNPLGSILFTLANDLSYTAFLTTSFFTTSLKLSFLHFSLKEIHFLEMDQGILLIVS